MRNFIITFLSVVFLFTLFRIMFMYIGWQDNYATDWSGVFYPVLKANDPYQIEGYFNPPWLQWLLLPLSLLSQTDSQVLWIAIIFLLIVKSVYALGGNWLSVILTVASPGFLITILHGQIDILVLYGFLIGSWFMILIKPQVLGMSVLYQVIVRKRIDWLSIVLVLLSFVISGLWILKIHGRPLEIANVSVWPYGIPFGILLFGISLVKKDMILAGLSTFFLVPYFSDSSTLVLSAIILSRFNKIIAIVFSVLLWILAIKWFI